MADNHLNSVHLDLGRRDDFRRARDCVLQACGANTIRSNGHELPAPQRGDHTLPEPACHAAVFLVEGPRRRYALHVGINSVGRLPDNDVVVADAHVSRRHFSIVVHVSRDCEIHDVASKNGTYLNGNRVSSPTRLRSGDEIRAGDLVLTFLNAIASPSDKTNVDQPPAP